MALSRSNVFSNASLEAGVAAVANQHVKTEKPEDRESIERELKDPLA